jgi:phenylpropionate dioxygenase-like ring-hydroxylating dioxygenase large terminal subunit
MHDLSVDVAPLRRYWHPVAYAHELGGAPLAVTILDEPVVLVRADAGVHAFRDLCPHRGARLSLGRLEDGRLVCPYHGFEYDTEGRCTFIPSQPRDRQAIPARLRLERYEAIERYGLVWVALEPPELPLPEFPEFEEPGYHSHCARAEHWQTSAARWAENFLDITHFAHVHPGILGDPARPECEPYDVHETPTGMEYEYDTGFQGDPAYWPTDEDPTIRLETTHMRARLFLPFTIVFTIEADEGRWSTLCPALPASANRVTFFSVHARNYALDVPDESLNRLAEVIFEQDRLVSESQHPEMLPVDLTEEVHLRIGDAIGIAYRRRLRELGLTYA